MDETTCEEEWTVEVEGWRRAPRQENPPPKNTGKGCTPYPAAESARRLNSEAPDASMRDSSAAYTTSKGAAK